MHFKQDKELSTLPVCYILMIPPKLENSLD